MAYFSFLSVMFLLCVASSYAQVDVHTICQKAKDPSFCLKLLNSKPGPKDLVSLAQYTIDVARTKATGTIQLIKKQLANSGGNVNATRHYKSCLSHFGNEDGVLGEIESVQQFLKAKDYPSASTYASSILTDVDDCISGESPGEPPFHDPSSLPQYAKVVEQVAEIVLIISNFLTHN